MVSIQVSTINTRGLNDPIKCETVFKYLHETGGDIFLLQECALPFRDNYINFQNRWKYGQSFWSGDNLNKSSGVVVLLNNQSFQIEKVENIIDGRLLLIDMERNGSKMRLINIYGNTELQERVSLLQTIQRYVCSGRHIIVGGDFNCNLEKRAGNTTACSVGRLDLSSHVLSNLIKDCKLTDVFNFLHPRDPGFTWSNGKTSSRIDFILTSSSFTPFSCVVDPVPFSDHHILTCIIRSKHPQKQSLGVWKLNTSLLTNLRVVTKYKLKFKQWSSLRPLFDTVGEWWGDIKDRTKRFFIKEGRRIAEEKRKWKKRKQAKLQRYYNLLHAGFQVNDEIVKLKKELMVVLNEESKGVLIRSRVKYLEENEKCTRYFFRKVVRSKTSINKLINNKGEELNDNQQILLEVYDFYRNLYDGQQMQGEVSFFLAKMKKKLTQIEKEKLDQELTINELTKAMLSMQNNKSPGLDGLPKEYYFTFWDILKSPLLQVYKEALERGILPGTMNQGMISLLYKKGPQNDLRNWRPLTLLGVDVKILSKVLFLRLQPVISNLIGAEQTCGVPGRRMTDSLFLVRDTYLYCQERKLPLAMMGIDLEKAFDSINHKFLEQILCHLQFGKEFKRWIKLLYNEVSSVVMVNGSLTQPFKIKMGVRQGCPLSPLLFIMTIEPLACAIRENKVIRGIIPPGNEGKDVKLTMYMDDLTLLLSDNTSIHESLTICEKFTLVSGMKINKHKSEIFYSNWNEIRENWSLIEKDKVIKILGVQIGENMVIENWKTKLQKIQGKLLQWEDRELTFIGKVLIIKTEVISSLAYLAATFPMPHQILAVIRKTMFRFLWGSQQERLKRDIMYRSMVKGGRDVPNLGVKFKAIFITPILRACLHLPPDPIWAPFVRFWLGGRVLKAWGKRVVLHTPFSDRYPAIFQTVVQSLKCGLNEITLETFKFKNVEVKLSPDRLTPIDKLNEENAKIAWKNVNNKKLSNIHKDIAWQITNKCIATRDFLYRRNLTKSPQCPRPKCGDDETIKHLFWECPFTQKVWSLISPWLYKLSKEVLTYEKIVYGLLKDEWEKNELYWWIVINCVKETIWKTRNILIHKKQVITESSVIKNVVLQVRDYIWKNSRGKKSEEEARVWKVPFYLLDLIK